MFEIEGVTSLLGKKRQESQLGSAVAIPEGVNGVQLGEDVSRAGGESVLVEAAQKSGDPELVEDAPKLGLDVLGIAERAFALAVPE